MEEPAHRPRVSMPPPPVGGPEDDPDPTPEIEEAVAALDLRGKAVVAALGTFWWATPAAALAWTLVLPLALGLAGLAASSLVVALLLGFTDDEPETAYRLEGPE